jgi:predicted TIM-barrel fold metal-dependent hydrolase
MAKYGKHPKRFIVWCGIDYTGFDKPGFGPARSRNSSAATTGIGELSDKGRGLGATTNSPGMHINDSRMDPILAKCAELRLPINIHVGEDRWMYEPMDESNDGEENLSRERGAVRTRCLPLDLGIMFRTFSVLLHQFLDHRIEQALQSRGQDRLTVQGARDKSKSTETQIR